MPFHAEDLVLFVEGAEDMYPDRISGVRHERRGRRAAFAGDAGGEHGPEIAAMIHPIHPRLAPVVDPGETSDPLNVRHKGGADDVVLVLEEKRRVAEIGASRV